MVLVHHQVAHRQVGVGLQLLTVGDMLGRPGRLFPRACAAFGQNGQLFGGILHAGGQTAHGDGGGSGAGQSLGLELHGGFDALLPQHLLKIQTALLAARQHQNGETGGLVVGQILHRGVQTGPEGGQLLGGDRDEGAGRHRIGGDGKGVQEHQGELLHGPEQPARSQGQVGAGGVQLPPLQQGLDVLLQLPLIGLGPLLHPGALAEHDAGVGGQIVQRGGQLRVDQGQIPVGGGEDSLFQGFAVLGQCGGQVVQSLFPGLGGQLFQLGRQSGQTAGGQVGQHLRRRQQQGAVHVLRPPLGGGVEGAHGVDLVPPELCADGVFHAGGEYVQNPSPQGKLAHPLHLVAPGIAHVGQLLGQGVQVIAGPGLQLQPGAGKGLGRDGVLHQGLRRGHQKGDLSPAQLVQQSQAAVLPLAADGGSGVENIGAGGEQRYLDLCQGGEIPGHASGLPLVGADHHRGAAGDQTQSGGKVGPVDGGQAGHSGGAGSAVYGGEQLFKFRQGVQGVSEQFHGSSS